LLCWLIAELFPLPFFLLLELLIFVIALLQLISIMSSSTTQPLNKVLIKLKQQQKVDSSTGSSSNSNSNTNTKNKLDLEKLRQEAMQ